MSFDNVNLVDVKPRKNQYVFLTVVVCTAIIHPTVMGYDSMMIGSILNLPLYTTYFDLTPVTIGLNTASMWMGQIITCLVINCYFTDKCGRRPTILVGLLLTIVGVVLQTAAQNIGMFVVARIILGGGCSACLVAASTLVTELAPIKKRGLLSGLCFTCFGFGGIIASVVTFGSRNVPGTWSWRIPSLVQGSFSLFAATSLIFTPESPQFLLMKGKKEKAVEILATCQNVSPEAADALADEYLIEIEENSNKGAHKGFPWLQFFKGKANRRRLVIFFSQAVITELAGSSVGSYFFSLLLDLAGVTDVTSKLQVNIIMSLWSLLASAVGAFAFDYIGRKKQALISLSGMVASFYILGGLIKRFGSGESVHGLYGAIAMMFIFTGFYGFTFTPLTMAYPAEISPIHSRGSGISLFVVMNSSFGLLSSFVLPIAMSNIGWKFYFINASYDVLFLPVIYYFWVETKNLDFCDIAAKFGDCENVEYVSEGQLIEEVVEIVTMKT